MPLVVACSLPLVLLSRWLLVPPSVQVIAIGSFWWWSRWLRLLLCGGGGGCFPFVVVVVFVPLVEVVAVALLEEELPLVRLVMVVAPAGGVGWLSLLPVVVLVVSWPCSFGGGVEH